MILMPLSFLIISLMKVFKKSDIFRWVFFSFYFFFFYHIYLFFYNYIYFREDFAGRLVFNPITSVNEGTETFTFAGLLSIYFLIKYKKIRFFLIAIAFFLANVFLMNRSASILLIVFIFFYIWINFGPKFFLALALTSTPILFFASDLLYQIPIIQRLYFHGLSSSRLNLIQYGLNSMLELSVASPEDLNNLYNVKSYHFYLLDLIKYSNNLFILFLGIFFILYFYNCLLRLINCDFLYKFYLIIFFTFFLFSTANFELSFIIIAMVILLYLDMSTHFQSN